MKSKSQWLNLIDEMNERCSNKYSILIEGKNKSGRQIGGKFNLDTKEITIYVDEIIRQSNTFFKGTIDVLEYAKIILAHELGHAHDKHLIKLADQLDKNNDSSTQKKIAFLIEVNAWKFAKSILPDISYKLFSKVRWLSLEHYYNDMYDIYNE